jgi:hypothetical protein
MSMTKEPYVDFRPGGTSVLLMNLMVLVPFTPCFSPCAKQPISFDVDLIQLILYRNNVMSSVCFSDLPVSGEMTTLAISGMMLNFLCGWLRNNWCIQWHYGAGKNVICLLYRFIEHIL